MVISIVAILMAFIFPSVMKAKESATATADLSQLSQINKAFLMYISDHDGRYPPAIIESSDEGGVRIPGIPGRSAVYTWVHRIFPYVKSLETFWSPATKNCKLLIFISEIKFSAWDFAIFGSRAPECFQ